MGPSAPKPWAAAPSDPALLRRLAASLAHNVNNALTGAIGHLELALRQTAPKGPLANNLLASLACAHRAAETVRRVVTFVCQAPRPQQRERLSLRAIAIKALGALRDESWPGLCVQLGDDRPGWALGDPALVSGAIEQVLVNAAEAMPEGGTVTVHIEEHDGRAALIIRDTGPGLPDVVRDHLFEPFLTTKPSGHLGLGLVLCRDMVEAQGGEMTLVSASGVGTAVTLAFPAASRAVDGPGTTGPDVAPQAIPNPVVPGPVHSSPASKAS